ncbi:hypothetical protein KUW19_00130 [Ferrimonas balearica]|uniref:hypothetical protein n=1 Tax=Ferrimonas balearica TaxID=44012 RepID=UPI001C98A229|nr:hypothetical protein [Ferrimonas balearica]MBY6104888.1 hypothetical protein [Ferrimonas balearica]
MTLDTTHSLMKELVDELHHWASQYGCRCNHPACKSCRDTKDAADLIARSKTMMEGTKNRCSRS